MLYEYNDEDQRRLFPEVVDARRRLSDRNNMSVIKLNLTDTGTRYKHLTELLDLWQVALDIAKRYDGNDKTRYTKLESAIELLQKHIDNLGQYDQGAWNIRDEIERVSKDPAKIQGGRGTPLKGETQ
jgi:hypothetical protein